ncbi:MAG: ribonuclease P protein component [Candidatus Levybacteria bacterium]|nr:ribonuclease P protein component [Candidatus Levybacteria bacterium]
MFKKENRLVPEVRFNNSCFFTASQFILKEKKNKLNINRFGIVVSKKIDNRAVGRNKIKRFFRASLMSLFEKMSLGHDILIIVKKGIAGKTNEENQLMVEKTLGKAGVIRMSY